MIFKCTVGYVLNIFILDMAENISLKVKFYAFEY